MWTYEKKLQYPVKIERPNPALAKLIISQFGGPDGELGASQRYLSQRYAAPYDEVKAVLTDIGIEDNYCALQLYMRRQQTYPFYPFIPRRWTSPQRRGFVDT